MIMLALTNLVGFAGGVSEPLTSITQALSATQANSSTITAPVGIQPNDLIVMFDAAFNPFASGPPTNVTPSGFDSIFSTNDGTSFSINASCKLASGSEGGTAITGMASGEMAKLIYVFRGNNPAVAKLVGDVGSQITSGNPTAQTITAASGVAPLVVLGFYGSSNLISPRTFTVGGVGAKDNEINAFDDGSFGDCDAWIAYKIYNSAPADAVVDMDDEGTINGLGSCYIQLS